MPKKDNEQVLTYVFLAIIIIIIAVIIISILYSNNSLNINENVNDKKDIENNNNTYIPNFNEGSNSSNPTPVKKEIEIAKYTTSIYDKEQNRMHNITLSLEKINNKIINPGEEFSFNKTVGSMDESQGFKKALAFDGKGKKIQMSGGGICQLSSTLYNTILIANLEVTERHAHSRRVAYVPVDKDATIVYGSLDLKFKNNTNTPIKITGTNDIDNVTITLYKIETSL